MKATRGMDDGTRTNNQSGSVVVELAAASYESLDAAALERVRGFLLGLADEACGAAVIVDLSNVQFCGARFIGVLMETWATLRRRHRRFAICGLTPYCGRLIRVLHLDKLFGLYPTQQAALDKIGRGFDSPAAAESSSMRLRIVTDEVSWYPSLVRIQWLGEDSDPIHCEIVPWTESPPRS